jgi:hypothetical protein
MPVGFGMPHAATCTALAFPNLFFVGRVKTAFVLQGVLFTCSAAGLILFEVLERFQKATLSAT